MQFYLKTLFFRVGILFFENPVSTDPLSDSYLFVAVMSQWSKLASATVHRRCQRKKIGLTE